MTEYYNNCHLDCHLEAFNNGLHSFMENSLCFWVDVNAVRMIWTKDLIEVNGNEQILLLPTKNLDVLFFCC